MPDRLFNLRHPMHDPVSLEYQQCDNQYNDKAFIAFIPFSMDKAQDEGDDNIDGRE